MNNILKWLIRNVPVHELLSYAAEQLITTYGQKGYDTVSRAATVPAWDVRWLANKLGIKGTADQEEAIAAFRKIGTTVADAIKLMNDLRAKNA